MKRSGAFITLIGLAGMIGGFASCRHFDDGDTASVAYRGEAAYTSCLVMILGAVVVAVGLYIRNRASKPK
jgi:hypothetical protein